MLYTSFHLLVHYLHLHYIPFLPGFLSPAEAICQRPEKLRVARRRAHLGISSGRPRRHAWDMGGSKILRSHFGTHIRCRNTCYSDNGPMILGITYVYGQNASQGLRLRGFIRGYMAIRTSNRFSITESSQPFLALITYTLNCVTPIDSRPVALTPTLASMWQDHTPSDRS